MKGKAGGGPAQELESRMWADRTWPHTPRRAEPWLTVVSKLCFTRGLHHGDRKPQPPGQGEQGGPHA